MRTTRVVSQRGSRRGYALLAVLWILAVVSTLSAGASLIARQAVSQANNRVALTRAEWLAEGCMERARSVIDEVMVARDGDIEYARAWREATQRLAMAPRDPSCSLSLSPVGARLSVNLASLAQLRRFFVACGLPMPLGDSLARAVIAIRRGLELAPGHVTDDGAMPTDPRRSREIADVRELWSLSEFARLSPTDSLRIASELTVERTRLDLSHAQPCTLASLPGVTPEAAEQLREMRTAASPPRDLAELAARLSTTARESITAHWTEFIAVAAVSSDAWLLVVHGNAGDPRIGVTLEARLAAVGHRAAVMRRREWIE